MDVFIINVVLGLMFVLCIITEYEVFRIEKQLHSMEGMFRLIWERVGYIRDDVKMLIEEKEEK